MRKRGDVMLTYLAIYVALYVTWYVINKIFDGRPDKYLRAKIWNIFETQYGMVIPDDMKQNPVKYFINDLKVTWHNMKGGKKHKDE